MIRFFWTILFTLAAVQTATAATLSADPAAERILISNAQRTQLGIKTGLDSIVDFWDAPDGGHYLVFSGALLEGGRGTFLVPANASYTAFTATSRSDIQIVLQPTASGNEFDRDYAGGGTVFTCPGAGGKILYFYHGENQTTPDGKRAKGGPLPGWTGIGMAVWNPATKKFQRDSQVLGMNGSNAWDKHDQDGNLITSQLAPLSGMPSVLAHADGYLYMYYSDMVDNPISLKAATRPTTAIARAKTDEVCTNAGTGKTTLWKKFHNGAFEEPGVFETDHAPNRPRGTGGRMSPMYERYHNMGEGIPNVTYVPSQKLYVMTAIQYPSTKITVRMSPDGFTWTDPVGIIGEQQPGTRHMYPRMHVVTDASGVESYSITYLRKSETAWTFAELVQQPLEWK